MNLRMLSVFLVSLLAISSQIAPMCRCESVNPAYVQLGGRVLDLATAKLYKFAFKELKSQYPEEFKRLAEACRDSADFAQTDMGGLLGEAAELILSKIGLIGDDGRPTEALKAAMQLYVDLSNNSPDAELVIRNAKDAMKADAQIIALSKADGKSLALKRIKTARLSRTNSAAQ